MGYETYAQRYCVGMSELGDSADQIRAISWIFEQLGKLGARSKGQEAAGARRAEGRLLRFALTDAFNACARRGSTAVFGPRRGRAARRLLGSVVGLVLLAGGGSASAATVPFNPAQPTVFIGQGSPTQLDKATQSGGAITFAPVGGTVSGLTYNAIGYDTCNNFIYGIQTSAANGQPVGAIIQVAGDGSISYPGINLSPPVADNVGAFGPDANCDDFYVGVSGGTSLTKVNLLTKTTSTVSVGGAILGPDITYSNGFFWSMGPPNQIQRISVTGLAPATFTVSVPGAAQTGVFGAAWTYGNGDVGFSNNTSGNIYEIRIANAASASPTFTTVISQTGPASSNNDGTNAPGLSTDLSLTKTLSPATVDPGGKITYTLTVTNNGPGNSSGYVLNDSLPAGLTNATTTSTGCTITSPAAVVCAGAPLAAGASVTDTITANAPNPFTGSLTNTATVTANENDPNASNNSASATLGANIRQGVDGQVGGRHAGLRPNRGPGRRHDYLFLQRDE